MPEETVGQNGDQENSTPSQPEQTFEESVMDLNNKVIGGDEEAEKSLRQIIDDNRDNLEKMKVISTAIEKSQSTYQPPEPESKTGEVSEAESKLTPEKETKLFYSHVHGERISRDDSDNLLGYGSTGKLKEAHLKQEYLMRDLEAEAKSLREKLEEAEAKQKSLPLPQQPDDKPVAQASSPSQSPPQPEVKKVEKPVAPEYPDLTSSDPDLQTENDRKNLAEYWKNLTQFNKQMVEYTSYLESRPPVIKQEIPADYATRLAELEAENKKIKTETANKEMQFRKEEVKKKYWDSIDVFADLHKEYKLPEPSRVLSEKVENWMGKLAKVCGKTDSEKATVTQQYLDGDEEVLKNAEGIPPPKGYDKYFALATEIKNLEKARDALIKRNEATSAMPYHKVWLLENEGNGQLDQNIEQAMIQERVKGTQGFAAAIENAEKTAKTIPPELSGQEPDMTQYGISTDDLVFFKANVGFREQQELSKNESLHRKWVAIKNKLEAAYAAT